MGRRLRADALAGMAELEYETGLLILGEGTGNLAHHLTVPTPGKQVATFSKKSPRWAGAFGRRLLSPGVARHDQPQTQT